MASSQRPPKKSRTRSQAKSVSARRAAADADPVDPVQRAIVRLEAELSGPVLVYGVADTATIAIGHAQVLRRLLANLPHACTLHVCLDAPNGDYRASLPVVRVLRRHCKRLEVFVPVRAVAGGTMIALGANLVRLGSCAYLSPLDGGEGAGASGHLLAPSCDTGSVLRTAVPVHHDEVRRVLALWRLENGHSTEHPLQHLFTYLHPLVIGALERASATARLMCHTLLSHHLDDMEVRRTIVEALVGGYPAHDYPIQLDEASQIGIPASGMTPDLETCLLGVVEHLRASAEDRQTDEEGLLQVRKRHVVLETRGLRAVDSEHIAYSDSSLDEDEAEWTEVSRRRGWSLTDLATGAQTGFTVAG